MYGADEIWVHIVVRKHERNSYVELSDIDIRWFISQTITYLLTPWCRVLLEKLTGLQIVKKFPAFHGTRRFIPALTTVRHLSLSSASPIQSIYPHPTSWRSILILPTHLRLGLPSGLFPFGFPTKTLYAPLSSSLLSSTNTTKLYYVYYFVRATCFDSHMFLYIFICCPNTIINIKIFFVWLIHHCISIYMCVKHVANIKVGLPGLDERTKWKCVLQLKKLERRWSLNQSISGVALWSSYQCDDSWISGPLRYAPALISKQLLTFQRSFLPYLQGLSGLRQTLKSLDGCIKLHVSNYTPNYTASSLKIRTFDSTSAKAYSFLIKTGILLDQLRYHQSSRPICCME